MADLVLVTGATGFLGSHIVKQLLDAGYDVRGTVRNLKNASKVEPLRQLPSRSRLELVEVDLMDKDLWKSVVKDCAYVIHTASPVPAGGLFKKLLQSGMLIDFFSQTDSLDNQFVVIKTSCL